MAYEEMTGTGAPPAPATRRSRWCRAGLALLIAPTVVMAVLAIYLAVRFGSNAPVVYADDEEHFKYGSTGGERESGFPLLDLPGACRRFAPRTCRAEATRRSA